MKWPADFSIGCELSPGEDRGNLKVSRSFSRWSRVILWGHDPPTLDAGEQLAAQAARQANRVASD